MFTGEALVRSARLDGGRGVVQRGFSSRGSEEGRFPDVLPVRSGLAGAFANASSNGGALRGPVVAAPGDLVETRADELRDVGRGENLHATLPALEHHHEVHPLLAQYRSEILVASSDVDAEYETDDEYISALPQPPATTTSNNNTHNDNHDDRLPSSTPRRPHPRTASPTGTTTTSSASGSGKPSAKRATSQCWPTSPGRRSRCLLRCGRGTRSGARCWVARGGRRGSRRSVGEWFEE